MLAAVKYTMASDAMATDAMATARSLALKLGTGQWIGLLEYGQGLLLADRQLRLGMTSLERATLVLVDWVLVLCCGLAGHTPRKPLRTLTRWGQIATKEIFRLERGMKT